MLLVGVEEEEASSEEEELIEKETLMEEGNQEEGGEEEEEGMRAEKSRKILPCSWQQILRKQYVWEAAFWDGKVGDIAAAGPAVEYLIAKALGIFDEGCA